MKRQKIPTSLIMELFFTVLGLTWLGLSYNVKNNYVAPASATTFGGPHSFPLVICWVMVLTAIVAACLDFRKYRASCKQAAEAPAEEAPAVAAEPAEAAAPATAEPVSEQPAKKVNFFGKVNAFIENHDSFRVFALIATSAVYVFTMSDLGYLPTTIVYFAIVLKLFMVKNNKLWIALSVALPVLLYLFFKVLIKVQLP